MAVRDRKYLDALRPWLPLYEGFLTYGGMSTKEIEAMAVGLREMTDPAVASSSLDLIAHLAATLQARGVPVVQPPGGLACHIDARRFLPHVPKERYIGGRTYVGTFGEEGAPS